MAAHEFIIGLGGVGGQCIAAFKRNCKVHSKDYELIRSKGASPFQYLYIDSSDDICKLDEPWKVYGKSVRLDETDIILMNDMSGKSVSSVSAEKNVKAWIGDIGQAYSNFQGESKSELFGLKGAGQLRRYGRVLFATHASTIQDALLDKIRKLISNATGDVNFRIFCTLGGGTGSGGIIDLVTMIREMERDLSTSEFKIFIYPFVGGKIAGKEGDTGSFFENEYAALRDLNAMAMGLHYTPHLVCGAQAGSRFNLQGCPFPITNICLSSEVSEGTPDIEQQVDYMVKACFDTILYEYTSNNAKCLKSITNEDLEIHKGEGIDLADQTPAQILRSYKFSAIASKRWCVPTTQIAEYLRLKREVAMLESLLDGAPLPNPNMTRQLELDLAFRMTNSETLKILNDKSVDLLASLNKEKNEAIKKGKFDKEELSLLHELSDVAVKKANSLDRDQQLALNLDSAIKADIAGLMADFVEKVETQLDWVSVTNAWGIKDIITYLERYEKQTVEKWKTTHAVSRSVDEKEAVETGCILKMEQREKEWAKLGPLVKLALTNWKVIPMLENQCMDATTRVECVFDAYKANVIQKMVTEAKRALGAYRAKVKRAADDIKARKDTVEKDAKAILDALEGNTDKPNLAEQYEFSVDELKDVVKYIQDKMADEHRRQMADVFCPVWKEYIGTLNKYKEKLFEAVNTPLSEKLYDASAEMERSAADQLGYSDLLVSNVLEKLKGIAGHSDNEEDWERQLGDKIRKLMASFRLSVSMPKSVSGRMAGSQTSPQRTLCIGFPNRAPKDKFYNWIQDAMFKALKTEYRPSAGKVDVFFHDSDDEIRVMFIPYWMPACFANITNIVYKKYMATVQKRETGAPKLYFANIDDDEKISPATKPCISRDGDPNMHHFRKVELGKKLYVNITKPNGEVERRAIVKETENGFSVLKNNNLLPDYEQYDADMQFHPDAAAEEILTHAYTLALTSMSKEEKQCVVSEKEKMVWAIYEKSQDAASSEYVENKEELDALKKVLGL